MAFKFTWELRPCVLPPVFLETRPVPPDEPEKPERQEAEVEEPRPERGGMPFQCKPCLYMNICKAGKNAAPLFHSQGRLAKAQGPLCPYGGRDKHGNLHALFVVDDGGTRSRTNVMSGLMSVCCQLMRAR